MAQSNRKLYGDRQVREALEMEVIPQLKSTHNFKDKSVQAAFEDVCNHLVSCGQGRLTNQQYIKDTINTLGKYANGDTNAKLYNSLYDIAEEYYNLPTSTDWGDATAALANRKLVGALHCLMGIISEKPDDFFDLNTN